MNDNIEFEYLPFKKQLFYFCYGKNKIIKNDPIFKLQLSFNKEDITSILELDNTEIIKNLYFNKEKIYKFLCNSREVIQINYDMCKNCLHNLFYLNLILNYRPEIINYKYDIYFIKEIYQNNIKENKNKFKQIMMSKIIYDLINYFKQTNYYDEGKDREEISKLEKDTLETIEKDITIFKTLNLDFTKEYILRNKIDFLYKEIIISLININFKANAIDIFKQLDLNNIILNESITDEIWEILISKKYTDYFEVNNIKDLFNSEKLEFFYIFFKYIFKSNFYLFKTEILEFRKKVTDIIFSGRKIKQMFFDAYSRQNYKIKKQIIFVFKSLLMYFYYRLILREIKDKDPYILLDNSYYIYTISKKKGNESPIDNIKCILLEEEYSEVPECLEISLPEKYMSFKTFINDFKEKIENKCNNYSKLMITLNLKIVGDLEDACIYNIDSIYECERLDYEPNDEDYANRIKKYKDENILVNGLSEGFEFLIDEINDESYNKIINNN